MRKNALAALWTALLAQIVWTIVIVFHHGFKEIWYEFLVTAGFVALALTRGRYRWITSALRIFVGLAFLASVCDRFGLFGKPGTPGVTWGNFQNFITYTGAVNSFLPAQLIPILAIFESVIEGALGLGMIAGIFLRWTVPASAALLTSFFCAMTASLGIESTFPYAVAVMAAGAWLMSVIDASLLSVDSRYVGQNDERSQRSARTPNSYKSRLPPAHKIRFGWRNRGVEIARIRSTKRKEENMKYLVDMKVTDANRPTTLAEGMLFIDQYIIPSLEICKKWMAENKIIAGGPVGGSMEIVMIVDVGSLEELDNLLESLPIWPRMHTSVKELVTFDTRINGVRSRLERIISMADAQHKG